MTRELAFVNSCESERWTISVQMNGFMMEGNGNGLAVRYSLNL